MYKRQDGFGTGAAVADIDNDGILELLVSRGESKEQPLTLYKAKVDKQNKYLRIKPLNKFGAPARGAQLHYLQIKENIQKLLMLDLVICVKWSLWHIMELEKMKKILE